MKLTLCGQTALRITRTLRSSQDRGSLAMRCDLTPPDPGPGGRWSTRAIARELEWLGPAAQPSEERRLDVLVPRKEQRLQLKNVHCTFRLCEHPEGSFVRLRDGLCMSSPELLFVEMGRVMSLANHLLLGMELCGRFSRDALDPRNGPICYDVEPATTVERLRAFALQATGIRGAARALQTIDLIAENAWSPMEAAVAAVCVLPVEELGYDLWPIDLNERQHAPGMREVPLAKETRVPDILFRGTSVGLNYDGEDHFGLEAIAQAARELGEDPENAQLAAALERALAESRSRIVDDKRRDRDLAALGLTVFAITREDLSEPGGFDLVARQVIDAIEATSGRDMGLQRTALENPALARARQDLIWSLMPGKRAEEAYRRVLRRL